jgi:hypothetical protein
MHDPWLAVAAETYSEGSRQSGNNIEELSEKRSVQATSQQYFSLRTNQASVTSQQYFSLRTNQHQPSATSQPNRLQMSFLVRSRHEAPPSANEGLKGP